MYWLFLPLAAVLSFFFRFPLSLLLPGGMIDYPDLVGKKENSDDFDVVTRPRRVTTQFTTQLTKFSLLNKTQHNIT